MVMTTRDIGSRLGAFRWMPPLLSHLRRRAWAYGCLLMLAVWLQQHYTLGLNATDSLPGRLFLIERHQMPDRGELVAFRWHGSSHYPNGTTFIKVLEGLPGDSVAQMDGVFYVNAQAVGRAKPLDKLGQTLNPGPVGTLPEGRFFVWSPHPDSLDSRYELTGWIARDQVLGRARVLF